MPFGYAHTAIYQEVYFDGVVSSDTSGAQAVDTFDVGDSMDDLCDLAFDRGAETYFGQLVKGRAKDAPSHFYDEEAHDACRQRLEEKPMIPEEDRSRDTEEDGE